MAGTADLLVSPNDVTNFTFTYTHINTLANQELYREGYAQWDYQGLQTWKFTLGAQYLEYNISLYQSKTLSQPILYAITPFTEITYLISDNKSLRAEFQYMDTKQDYGSWLFALLEYNLAPRWSVSASEMYNVAINKNADNPDYTDPGFQRGLTVFLSLM
jgi:hypothetical protein